MTSPIVSLFAKMLLSCYGSLVLVSVVVFAAAAAAAVVVVVVVLSECGVQVHVHTWVLG